MAVCLLLTVRLATGRGIFVSSPLRQRSHPGHAALGSGPVGRDERSNRFFHKTGSEPPLRWFNFQPSTDFSKKLTNPSPHVTSTRISLRDFIPSGIYAGGVQETHDFGIEGSFRIIKRAVTTNISFSEIWVILQACLDKFWPFIGDGMHQQGRS